MKNISKKLSFLIVFSLLMCISITPSSAEGFLGDGDDGGLNEEGEFSLTLETNIYGKEPTEIWFDESGSYALPADVTNSGYEFKGWYESPDFSGAAVTGNYTVSENTTLYAYWLPSGGTIALNTYNVDSSNVKSALLNGAYSGTSLIDTLKTKCNGSAYTLSFADVPVVTGEESYFEIKVANDGNMTIYATDDAAMAASVKRLIKFSETAGGAASVKFTAGTSLKQSFFPADDDYYYSWGDEFEGLLNRELWSDWGSVGTFNAKINDTVYENKRLITASSSARNTDGKLVLPTYKMENDDGPYFTGTNISTGSAFNFRYGMIEFRAKITAAPAATAIWFDAAYKESGKQYVELDLMETIKGTEATWLEQILGGKSLDVDQTFPSNIHIWPKPEGYTHKMDLVSLDKNGRYTVTDNNYKLSSAYHTYSMYWTDTEIHFYVDGYKFYSDTLVNIAGYLKGDKSDSSEALEALKQPLYIILSGTMGNSNYGEAWKDGDITSTDVSFEYVRLYQRSSDTGGLKNESEHSEQKNFDAANSRYAFLAQKNARFADSYAHDIVIGDTLTPLTIQAYENNLLPCNYKIGTKYIKGWKVNGLQADSKYVYYDPGKTYVADYVDTKMLEIKYQTGNELKTNSSGASCRDLRILSTVNSLGYRMTGFVFSKSQANPTVGGWQCYTAKTTNVYSQMAENVNNVVTYKKPTDVDYDGYSKYFSAFVINNVTFNTPLYARSFVVLNDGTIVYGSVREITLTE